MSRVTIIDYGVGNLLSVSRAFQYCGVDSIITNDTMLIENADRLVLPGVGAFSNAMKELKKKNLVEAINNFVTTERPFLGICLGMQMMLDSSEEFGKHKGLGLIPGTVEAIPDCGINGEHHKIPHISWNKLYLPSNTTWENTILKYISDGEFVYFVHSYTAFPVDEKHRLADTYYNGRRISAVIRKGYLFGCQFHPEKSGQTGLKIIKQFSEL